MEDMEGVGVKSDLHRCQWVDIISYFMVSCFMLLPAVCEILALYWSSDVIDYVFISVLKN